MNSSLEGALVFFTDWRNNSTNMFVTATLGEVMVNGNGVIESLEDSTLYLSNPPAAFSISIPLEDCAANPYDPEARCGIDALDDGVLALGYKFG